MPESSVLRIGLECVQNVAIFPLWCIIKLLILCCVSSTHTVRATRMYHHVLFPNDAVAAFLWCSFLEMIDPEFPEDRFVKKVLFLKFKRQQHEVIVVQIWNGKTNAHEGWLRLERAGEDVRRNAKPRRTEDQREQPGSSGSFGYSRLPENRVAGTYNPDRYKNSQAVIVSTITFTGNTIPTLADLVLATRAVSNMYKRPPPFTFYEHWFTDSILAILEHVAGPSNYRVEFRPGWVKRFPKGKGERLSQFSKVWAGLPVDVPDAPILQDLVREFRAQKAKYQNHCNAVEEERRKEEEEILRPLLAQIAERVKIIAERTQVIAMLEEQKRLAAQLKALEAMRLSGDEGAMRAILEENRVA